MSDAAKRIPATPDALEGAVAAFLEACGRSTEERDLQGTPRRVAELWRAQFLDGYELDSAIILGDLVEGEGDNEIVVVRDIPCHGMCPHHLMPWTGRATVAYLPEAALVGFGRLAQLVRAHTHRLTLHERACNEIADALVEHLAARGSACVITATHNCLNVPEDKHGTHVVAASYRGEFKTRRDLQAQLVA
jgi:GTP cyclohydrolase I